MQFCQACGSEIPEYDSGYYARNMMCIPCYVRKNSEVPLVTCARCGVRINKIESKERKGQLYCNYCFSELERLEHLPTCSICNKKIEPSEKSMKSAAGLIAHADCVRKKDEQKLHRIFEPGQADLHRTILSSMMGRIEGMLAY
jgi:hypothetical protein